tara:strand:- start:218 stop:514 length:297 start_codon:yes stop_codon:yes gene_type:complete
MIIYETTWHGEGEPEQQFFQTKREAIEFAETYPTTEDGEQYPMRVIRIETPRPTASLLFHVIKSQGGGYALSQKTVWKNDAQKEHDKEIESMGWEVEK